MGLNSVFYFSYTGDHIMVKDQCLPCYLPIAGGKVDGFIPIYTYSRLFAPWEIQRTWIWTRVTVSISSDDNHCTTNASVCRRYKVLAKFLKKEREVLIQAIRIYSQDRGREFNNEIYAMIIMIKAYIPMIMAYILLLK